MRPHVTVSITGPSSATPSQEAGLQRLSATEARMVDAARRLLLPDVYVPEVNFENAMASLGGVEQVRKLLRRDATETQVTELCTEFLNGWQTHRGQDGSKDVGSLRECAKKLVGHVDPNYAFNETLSFSRKGLTPL